MLIAPLLTGVTALSYQDRDDTDHGRPCVFEEQSAEFLLNLCIVSLKCTIFACLTRLIMMIR